jgi:hypothetical protein
LNQRPLPCQGSALPTELRDQIRVVILHKICLNPNYASLYLMVKTSITITARVITTSAKLNTG